MDDEYVLSIIREQGRQIGLLGNAVANLVIALERQRQRIQLLEAGQAISEIHEERRTLN